MNSNILLFMAAGFIFLAVHKYIKERSRTRKRALDIPEIVQDLPDLSGSKGVKVAINPEGKFIWDFRDTEWGFGIIYYNRIGEDELEIVGVAAGLERGHFMVFPSDNKYGNIAFVVREIKTISGPDMVFKAKIEVIGYCRE